MRLAVRVDLYQKKRGGRDNSKILCSCGVHAPCLGKISLSCVTCPLELNADRQKKLRTDKSFLFLRLIHGCILLLRSGRFVKLGIHHLRSTIKKRHKEMKLIPTQLLRQRLTHVTLTRRCTSTRCITINLHFSCDERS
jgi:hypothetical protein